MARSPTPALQPTAAPASKAPSKAAARTRTASRLRTTLRHGLPVLGVVVVVVLVAAIAYVVYDANRKGARTLSNDLITAIDRRVGAQMRSYLTPPQQFLVLADAAAAGRSVVEAAPEMERFARHAIANIPSVSAFSYADAQGNFLFVVRNDKGGFDTKTIDRREGRRVTWERRDGNNKTIFIEEDPGDAFDPRTRPWYQGAESTRKMFWTDTYLFYTLKKPGLTVALPHFDSDGKLQTVIAVDIEIATLCAYLEQLHIGTKGRALIVDAAGRIIAYPDDKWVPATDPEAKAPRLDEVGDPVLTRAYDLLRIEGYGRKTLDFGQERIIVSSEPVRRLTSRDWVVLIVVPETDFVGFVSDSRRHRPRHVGRRRADRRRAHRPAGLAQRPGRTARRRRDHAPGGVGDPHPDLHRPGARCRGRRRRRGRSFPGDGERRRRLRRQARGDLAAEPRWPHADLRRLLRQHRA